MNFAELRICFLATIKLETVRKKTKQNKGNCLIHAGWDENAGQEMFLQIRQFVARARQGIIGKPFLTVTFTSANNGAPAQEGCLS